MILRTALLLLSVSLRVPAAANTYAAPEDHLKHFGYWQAIKPGDGSSYLRDTAGYSNFEWAGSSEIERDAEGIFRSSRQAGMKVLIDVEQLLIDDYNQSESIEARWAAFRDKVKPHAADVAFFLLASEPEGGEYPWANKGDWLTKVKPLFEKWRMRLKREFPGVPSYINYTADRVHDWAPAYLFPADVVSFDNYFCWERCYGGVAFTDLVKELERKLPDSLVMLVPTAHVPADRANVEEAENEALALADKYLALAKADPKVIGLFPFNWWTVDGMLTGARALPRLKAKYAQIGHEIVDRKEPGISTPTVTQAWPKAITNERSLFVEVRGSGFAPGAVCAYFGPATGTAPAEVLSATALRVKVAPGMKPGAYTFVIRNPDGRQSARTAMAVNIGRDDAKFVAGDAPPTRLAPGQRATVSATFKNTGETTWSAEGRYAVGSQNPQDNRTWGGSRVALTGAQTVAPGATKTFYFPVVAPLTPGIYDLQVQLLREGVRWFGEKSPNVRVTVAAGAAPRTGPGGPDGTGQGAAAAAAEFRNALREWKDGGALSDPDTHTQSAASFRSYLRLLADSVPKENRELPLGLLGDAATAERLRLALIASAPGRNGQPSGGNGGPDGAGGGGGTLTRLAPIDGAGPSRDAVAYLASMFASMPDADRKKLIAACEDQDGCDIPNACIATGLYAECLRACAANPECKWPEEPGVATATGDDPGSDACSAGDNTKKPAGAPEPGMGEICVEAPPGRAYFVVGPGGPENSWGWNGPKCFQGHPAGTYSVNTNGNYGYPTVGDTDVRAKVSPPSGRLENGKTLTFNVKFCKAVGHASPN